MRFVYSQKPSKHAGGKREKENHLKIRKKKRKTAKEARRKNRFAKQ